MVDPKYAGARGGERATKLAANQWPSDHARVANLFVLPSDDFYVYNSGLIRWIVFHNPTGGALGIIGAIPGFGGLAILPFAPYIVDIYGRRTGIALGCLIVFLGALLQTFPPGSNPTPMYLAGRFFIGVGGTLTNGGCPLLITEIAHPRHRGRVTTIYNTLWFLVSEFCIHCSWNFLGWLTAL